MATFHPPVDDVHDTPRNRRPGLPPRGAVLRVRHADGPAKRNAARYKRVKEGGFHGEGVLDEVITVLLAVLPAEGAERDPIAKGVGISLTSPGVRGKKVWHR